MLDKKQTRAIFLSSKCKALETAHNINDAFDSRTANECTVQWWITKFCKGDKSLEGEERSDWSSELTTTNWEKSLKVDPTQEIAKELNTDHSMVIQIWSNLEKWKNSISGCLMSWRQIKK